MNQFCMLGLGITAGIAIIISPLASVLVLVAAMAAWGMV